MANQNQSTHHRIEKNHFEAGPPLPSTAQFAWAFFKIGLTAYGMAILQQLKALIIGRKWLSQKEVDEGLAMVQLYPGPIMFNLATYCAYRIKGFGGAAVATVMFVLPSYLLMVLLSWIYFNYGSVSWVHPIFIALEAMVVGVVIHIFLDFSNRYLKDGKTTALAALAFILMLYQMNAFWVILICLLLGIAIFWNRKPEKAGETAASVAMIPGKLSHRLAQILLTGGIFLGIIGVGLLWKDSSGMLLLSMFKVGAVAFGNGMTIMPLLQQEAVISHHWLTMKQFTDGIAFGQITPGPFLITATFIGYKVGGLGGSLLATIGMFFPSFFYTLIMSEIYTRIKNNSIIQAALTGILAAFTGMLLFVVLSLGKVSLVSPAAYIWTAGALILVRYYKVNILWIFIIGIVAALGLFFGGVSLG